MSVVIALGGVVAASTVGMFATGAVFGLVDLVLRATGGRGHR